jgi:hypothetical protein
LASSNLEGCGGHELESVIVKGYGFRRVERNLSTKILRLFGEDYGMSSAELQTCKYEGRIAPETNDTWKSSAEICERGGVASIIPDARSPWPEFKLRAGFEGFALPRTNFKFQNVE